MTERKFHKLMIIAAPQQRANLLSTGVDVILVWGTTLPIELLYSVCTVNSNLYNHNHSSVLMPMLTYGYR